MSDRVRVEVDGRSLTLSNLTKTMYPETGTTKAEVVDYYVRVAPFLVPHLAGRAITLRRCPDGVDGDSFFEKRCPGHRPAWMGTVPGPGDSGGAIDSCAIDGPAALAWTANMAALELHAPMALGADLESPTMVVFDLDPGAPAGIPECAAVALRIRELLDHLGLVAFAKTSGSKGMQCYVPLNTPATHAAASEFAYAVARILEKQTPDVVTSTMAKSARSGRIFVDWSQNSRHKTTVAVYSLRARPRPTVSTPVTWDEVDGAAGGAELSFEAADVLDRCAAMGDLFAGTLSIEQDLPGST